MGYRVTGEIDWDGMLQELTYTTEDLFELGEIIINGIVDGILDQTTPKGEPLDQGSRRTLAKKLREGKPLLSLQDTGKLRNPATYRITKTPNSIIIHLEPAYRDVHLDLIAISEKTGKNYRDFFDISQETADKLMKKAEMILEQKLERIIRG